MPRPRLNLPRTAARGEIVEIKALVAHNMESGQHRDVQGNPIPRKILNRFTCTFNGAPVFQADLFPGVSANPFLTFYARVEQTGRFEFIWTDDDGSVITESANIEVT
jgi:sulfur-oxidizing protein SoxZ